MMKLKIIIIAIIVAVPAYAQHFNNLYNHTAPASVLDGSVKSFLVTGYSTSHTPNDRPWPLILQEMLNLHAGNDTSYFVFKHTVSSTPIAKWTDICGTGSHIQDAIFDYINPGSQIPQGIPIPTIMLAQQSLQWAFGDCDDRYTNIESPGDTARINKAVDAIQLYTNSFLNAGIDNVYMATHIYKTGDYPLNLYGERWGLAKAIEETDNLLPGPELFTISKQLFPDGFADDKVHPGPEVATMMAVYWYLVLAAENADMQMAQDYATSAGVDLNHSLSENLIAYWPFNEAETDIAFDSTENHLDGQVFSSDRVAGYSETALDFDGVDDFVKISDYNTFAPKQISSLDKGTIAFWFNYESIYNGDIVPESLPILYFGQSSDADPQNGLEIYIGHNNLETSQKIFFTVHLNGRVELCFNNPTDLNSGSWYHYAVAIDSLDHRGYINGVEFNRIYNAGSSINHHGFFSTVPDGLNELLTIAYGRFSSNRFWHFNGIIDEVMIFDKALSSEEIQEIYNGTLAIENTDNNNDPLKVFPNPTSGILNIELNQEYKDFTVRIYNQVGQTIFSGRNTKQINLSSQASGIYFISIQTDTEILTDIIIKN